MASVSPFANTIRFGSQQKRNMSCSISFASDLFIVIWTNRVWFRYWLVVNISSVRFRQFASMRLATAIARSPIESRIGRTVDGQKWHTQRQNGEEKEWLLYIISVLLIKFNEIRACPKGLGHESGAHTHTHQPRIYVCSRRSNVDSKMESDFGQLFFGHT